MTTALAKPSSDVPSGGKVPLVELKDVGKSYGNITALKGICLRVHAGEVTGILGDNGAGKSTLIKIISGLHQQTDGELLVDGEPTKFNSPKEALGKGIATVYQNLAVVPLMPIWRNFFLGSELTSGFGPFDAASSSALVPTMAATTKPGPLFAPALAPPPAGLVSTPRTLAHGVHTRIRPPFAPKVVMRSASGAKPSGARAK